MCDPCAHRAVLRAVKALAKSPAARCIDPDAAMPWLPFTADAQVIRTKGFEELLSSLEEKAVEQYMDELEKVVDPRLEPIRELIADWKGDPEGLRDAVLDMVGRMKADLAKDVARVAMPYASVMADAGARIALESLPRLPEVDALITFGEANPLAVRAAEVAAVRMSASVSDTIARRIADTVGRGIDEGTPVTEIAREIEASGFTPAHAQMIARTESAFAYTEGRIEAWKETGVVGGKTWLLSPDACEFCEAAFRDHGTTPIPLDSPFYVQGHVLVGTVGGRMNLTYRSITAPPLHPNCRCDIIATLARNIPATP